LSKCLQNFFASGEVGRGVVRGHGGMLPAEEPNPVDL
jgi:hypothetical protein